MNRLYRGMVEASIRKAADAARQAAAYDHDGVRGRAREIFVTEMLTPLLYPTMGVCTGVVIDCGGRESGQTDVIVYDRRIVPPLILQAGEGAIPCESVLFAIEVKSRLTRQELEKSVAAACRMKSLMFGIALPTRSGWVSSIPCAVFAFETDLGNERGIADEERRLHDVVADRNAGECNGPAIRVPLSALTVATRGHAECVDANADPPTWRRFANSAERPEEGPLRFLSWMNREAPALSAQRATIPLGLYLGTEAGGAWSVGMADEPPHPRKPSE
jgi:hypothetical protein